MTPVGAVRPGPAIELVAAAIRAARDGSSFVARETVERLEQGINDRLTKRLSGLADLGFAPVAGGCGEVRTLIGQDRIGSVDRPLRKIFPAVDNAGFHGRALRRLRILWSIPVRSGCAMGIAFAPIQFLRLRPR